MQLHIPTFSPALLASRSFMHFSGITAALLSQTTPHILMEDESGASEKLVLALLSRQEGEEELGRPLLWLQHKEIY